MEKTRFAVIGTNFVTEWFLKEALLRDGFALQAVYSRTMERAKEFAAQYGGGVTAYDDLDAMLRDDAVDAVYIASPNYAHARQAIGALEHGKHVLVEKPAAPSEEEFARMLSAAERNGRVLLEAMRPAHSPGLGAVREHIEKIAPLRVARITYCQYSSRYDAFKAGRVLNAFDPALKNGSLMDIGVYCAHVLVALFGYPELIAAQAFKLSNGIDGAGTILAQYPGMLAELSYSKVSDNVIPSELQGEGGTLVIDDICNPKELTLRLRKQEPIRLPVPAGSFGMGAEVDDFLQILRSGGAESYQRDSLLTIRLMDEVRRQTGIDFQPR